jgi:Flp pilus assembly protein TadG
VQSVTTRDPNERGQALVEFALIAPLLFILLFGIIQFGMTFGGQVGLSNAAREVARYASTVAPNSNAAVITQANAVLPRMIPAFNPGAATPTVLYCYYSNPTTPVTYSWKVVVSITYGHTLFVPLVGAIIDRFDGAADNRYTTTVREEMRVETQPLKTVPTGGPCSATSVGVNP